jgi:hypothetical protein
MSSVQDHIETIELYQKGCQPGSGTRAILAMDLLGAIERSDMSTKYNLAEIVTYIVNHVPRYMWGSYAKVDGWLKACREGKQEEWKKAYFD